jgi:hypothetical protein
MDIYRVIFGLFFLLDMSIFVVIQYFCNNPLELVFGLQMCLLIMRIFTIIFNFEYVFIYFHILEIFIFNLMYMVFISEVCDISHEIIMIYNFWLSGFFWCFTVLFIVCYNHSLKNANIQIEDIQVADEV